MLFNPWFVSALQQRHDVAEAFGTTQGQVDGVTGEILGDLATGGDFDVRLQGRRLLDDAERSHMSDVSRLVRILGVAVVVAAAVAVFAGRRLRREPVRLAGLLVATAAAIGVAAAVLALAFAVAFDAAFLAFHAIFFPPGTYLFGPGSDLIRLFPEGFWFEASITAGVVVLLSAAVTLTIGLFGRRRPSAPRPAGP